MGLVLASGLSRFVEPQLFGVHGTDATVYVTVSIAVALTGLIATGWPLRIAARIDPARTLRAD